MRKRNILWRRLKQKKKKNTSTEVCNKGVALLHDSKRRSFFEKLHNSTTKQFWRMLNRKASTMHSDDKQSTIVTVNLIQCMIFLKGHKLRIVVVASCSTMPPFGLLILVKANFDDARAQ